MRRSGAKVRLSVMALLCGVALVIVGLVQRSPEYAYSSNPGPTLFVTDSSSDAVTAYPATSSGDTAPLAPAPTGLSGPISVAIDGSGKIYALNSHTNAITIYAKTSSGDTAPIATIGGSNTGLNTP